MYEFETSTLVDPETHRGYRIERTNSGIYKVGYPIATETLHRVNLQVLLLLEPEAWENIQSASPDAAGLRLLLPKDEIVAEAVLQARNRDIVYYDGSKRDQELKAIELRSKSVRTQSLWDAERSLNHLNLQPEALRTLITPGYPYSIQVLWGVNTSSVAVAERGTGGLAGSREYPVRAVWYSQQSP